MLLILWKCHILFWCNMTLTDNPWKHCFHLWHKWKSTKHLISIWVLVLHFNNHQTTFWVLFSGPIPIHMMSEFSFWILSPSINKIRYRNCIKWHHTESTIYTVKYAIWQDVKWKTNINVPFLHIFDTFVCVECLSKTLTHFVLPHPGEKRSGYRQVIMLGR